MRKVNSIPDVQIVLNDLLNRRNRDDNSNWDRKAYQIKNMGDGTDPTDAITLQQLTQAIDGISTSAVVVPSVPPPPSPFDDSYKKAFL